MLLFFFLAFPPLSFVHHVFCFDEVSQGQLLDTSVPQTHTLPAPCCFVFVGRKKSIAPPPSSNIFHSPTPEDRERDKAWGWPGEGIGTGID